MNSRLVMAVALAAMSGVSAWANLTVTASQTPDTLIPDYNTSSLNTIAESITLAGTGIQSITSVQVSLDIGAGGGGVPFNGDYYAYITDPSGSIAILLNRVGVTAASNPSDFGYGNTGFDVTFSASGSDIHNYQSGSYSLNSSGQLVGTWAPDGRASSPFAVQASDPQTDLLDDYDGSAADGVWTLVVADASTGSFGVLDSWGLEVTGTASTSPVPAPDWCGSGSCHF